MLAVVAVAAGLAFFAKMAQQQHAAAFGGFANVKHGVEFLQLNLLLLLAYVAFLDALAQQHQVVHAVAQPAGGGQAIAPCPAAFLVKMLHALRHIQVGNVAHVGLVYAHTKGNGGDDDDVFFMRETVLVLAAGLDGQACVIG